MITKGYTIGLDKKQVDELVQVLRRHCPVDTGNLRAGIQEATLEGTKWIITIGVPAGSEINGKNSDEYASYTNDSLFVGDSGKPNPNYHWVYNAIQEYLNTGIISITEEDEE